MYPILDRYGPFFLYSYSVVIGLGIVAGIGLAAWQANKRPRPYWFDGLLVSLAAGLIGGRIGFVWAEWPYFQEQLQEVWQVWQGGLSYHGALLAGLVALWVWSALGGKRTSFTAYAALLAPSFALGHAFGWLACWLEGCAYGRETVIGPLAADLPDRFGVYALRYQTQLLGVGLSLLVFLLVLAWRRRGSPDSSFWVALFGLGLSRAVITLFRGDPVPHLNGLRVDTLLDAFLALAALFLWLYQARATLRDK